MKILIVEDNELNQIFYAEMLEKHGHTPHIANNGEEFMGLYRSDSYDLIIMDYFLPDTTGLELIKEIGEIEKNSTKKTSVILITAFEEIKSLMSQKITATVFEKPIDFNKLLEFIDHSCKVSYTESYAKSTPYEQNGVFNLNYLMSVTNNDIKKINNFIEYHLETIEKNLEKLILLLNNCNYKEADKQLHFIRASIGNFNATKVIETLDSFRTILQQGIISQIDIILKQFLSDMNTLNSELIKTKNKA